MKRTPISTQKTQRKRGNSDRAKREKKHEKTRSYKRNRDRAIRPPSMGSHDETGNVKTLDHGTATKKEKQPRHMTSDWGIKADALINDPKVPGRLDTRQPWNSGGGGKGRYTHPDIKLKKLNLNKKGGKR